MENIGRILHSPACMEEGASFLAARVPRFAHVLETCGPPPLRRRDDGFEALVGAIVSQQVSVASARAIKARLENAGFVTEKDFADTDDDTLRAHGLSRQKARYVRALATAGIDFFSLRSATESEIIETLTAVPGIGRWTAEIYAMFGLGRADVFAANDLALQEAARILFDLPERPKERAIRVMAEDWSPWRTVAAGMLWHYYHHVKSREGIG